MNYKKLVLSILIVFGISLVGMAVYYEFADSRLDSNVPTFEMIPEKPEDFDAYMREIDQGMLYVLCDLPETYWKQPEFLGDVWERSRPLFYENTDYSRWGLYGYGAYPGVVGYGVENMKAGDEFDLCVYFHNGFGIWAWKSVRITPTYGGSEEYFDVEITPNELMVEPTFPVFGKDWIKQINIKVKAKKDIPNGNYNLGLDVIPPTTEFSQEMNSMVLQGEYENKELYIEECIKNLRDEDKCNELINLRQKKHVSGAKYKPQNSIFSLTVISEGNEYLNEIPEQNES